LIYECEAEEAEKWIKENKLRRVLIQAPPGLREEMLKLAERVSRLAEVFLHGGSCWGACDVAFSEAETVGADGIIHLGHARFLEREPVPTLYLECLVRDPRPLRSVLNEAVEGLRGYRRVGVGFTVQWRGFADLILEELKKAGIEPYIGRPVPPLRYPGQVLGCAYTTLLGLSSRVEAFLVIGSVFHGLGLALQTPKKVYAADPETGKTRDLEGDVDRILRSRYAYIEEFKSSRRVGVIVSVKPGQYRLGSGRRLAEILRKAGKQAEILIMNEVQADYLRDIPLEGFVNTACPRLSIEDQFRLEKPLLLPREALVAVGELEWEDVLRKPDYMRMEVA